MIELANFIGFVAQERVQKQIFTQCAVQNGVDWTLTENFAEVNSCLAELVQTGAEP